MWNGVHISWLRVRDSFGHLSRSVYENDLVYLPTFIVHEAVKDGRLEICLSGFEKDLMTARRSSIPR
jgi:hypothetical protein